MLSKMFKEDSLKVSEYYYNIRYVFVKLNIIQY